MRLFLFLLCFVVVFDATSKQGNHEKWECKNDVEIYCNDQHCVTTPQHEISSMSVIIELAENAKFDVCAYTGCWKGKSKIRRSGPFIILTDENVKKVTPSNDLQPVNIAIVLDKMDKTAIVKAARWSHPYKCKILTTRTNTTKSD